jgi:hypothetical protein
MQLNKLLLAALIVGCGAGEQFDEDGAELVTRGIPGPDDGPGLIDYASPDAPDVPAFQDPNYVEPDVEKWASAKYHGTASTALCYAPASAAKKCVFPPFKQINLITPNWNADVGGSNCATQRAYLASQGAAPGDFDAMVQAYLSGLTSINGIGTNVVIHLNNASGTNMTLKLYCASDPIALGAFVETHISNDTNGPNLPAVGGVDPSLGIKYLVSGPNTSYHYISFENVWWSTTDPTQCNVPPGPVRSLNLAEQAHHVGVHEGLHMMGFEHFASGVMKANTSCTPINTIPAAFGTALGLYNGNPSGGPTITDVGLGAQGIP